MGRTKRGRLFLQTAFVGLWLVALVATASAGNEPTRPEPIGELRFSIENPRDAAMDEIVRVSIPVPVGALPNGPPREVLRDGRPIAAQARVVTRHPDGSARRALMSFPLRLEPRTRAEFTLGLPADPTTTPDSPLVAVDGPRAVARAEAWEARWTDDGALRLLDRDGRALAVIRPFGPEPAAPEPATLTVVENGPVFAWLVWSRDAPDYRRDVEIQIDRRGALRLVARLLRRAKGNGPTPDFGFTLDAEGAASARPTPDSTRHGALPVGDPLARHPELTASLRLADGATLSAVNPLALRQHRGALETTTAGNSVNLRFSRLEPVARPDDELLIQQGMWRSMEIVLRPGSAGELAAAIDAPPIARVDWRLFDAVYRTGPPLVVEHPLLKSLVDAYVTNLQGTVLQGDDYGSLGGLERYNHCVPIWEDYFRGGDPRLRRVALDYSENYHDFSINWDPAPELYGGSRYPADDRTRPWFGTFRTRHNDAVPFCAKGYHGFWLAYEETGDPRFRLAAEAQARWASRWVHATVNYTRCIGQVTDFARLFEYTGDREHLAQAERLWREFQECQNPDLLFNEAGVPSTGNDLYVPDDSFGYKNPYVKSYIVQYATNALPDLLRHRPDDRRLRDTIIACNDWMARAQTAAGGWSYPGPTTAGFQWNIEYCHGLMAGYAVESKPEYLDAVGRDLRAIVALYGERKAIPTRVVPWETLAGKTAADLALMYRLGTDRDRARDFVDGQVVFGPPPDHLVYFQSLLRDYLAHRPESSLFSRDQTLERVLRMAAPPASGAGGGTGTPK